ncbi:DUF5049 domain-containing protein [Rivularia sp. UHCC 0363]|uniref:DUF5049 domain-containing protein n=1 Tax=Rivularia sp. UHCC 0363 TaxID=3110244 RepID=UPI002B202D7B|nr:DUF5049 domain-containing protein [Rivularia sp. UHCC 0363]MEA5595754.1 DUF5049 domain-containing protein [Rivularia sp. UHCC 0363]
MEMLLNNRPYLITALDAVKRTGQCNMFDSNCVIRTMQDLGYIEQADWLAAHLDDYVEILVVEYFDWMQINEPESLAQQLARETGLEVIEE